MGYKAVRTQRWKYIHYQELEGMDELYDLSVDPYEMRNLIGEPGARAAMEASQAECGAAGRRIYGSLNLREAGLKLSATDSRRRALRTGLLVAAPDERRDKLVPERHRRAVSLHDFTDSGFNTGLRLFQQTRVIRPVDRDGANLPHGFLAGPATSPRDRGHFEDRRILIDDDGWLIRPAA